MGPEDPSNRKEYPSCLLMPNFQKLQDNSKYESFKIGSSVPQKVRALFLTFPHEKITFKWSKVVSEP